MLQAKKSLKDCGRILTGLTTVLGAHSYFANRNATEQLTTIQKGITKFDSGVSKVIEEESIVSENIKNKIISNVLELHDDLKNLKKTVFDKYLNQPKPSAGSNENITSELQRMLTDQSYNKEEAGKLISKIVNKNQDTLNLLLDMNSNKFTGDINILDLIYDFKLYLNTLSLQELCLLINMSTIIFVILCLLTIIYSFYGDLLITKLRLEERLPKLAGIIRLRRKFLQFSLLFNILLITLALILMFVINFLTFFD